MTSGHSVLGLVYCRPTHRVQYHRPSRPIIGVGAYGRPKRSDVIYDVHGNEWVWDRCANIESSDI